VNRSWKLTVYKSWDEVTDSAFVEETMKWFRLDQESHVFYHPAMIKAWVETYRRYHDIYPLYCLAEQGDTKVFFPLVIWRRKLKNLFLRIIAPVGISNYDYHDPIVTVKRTQTLMSSFWKLIEEKLFDDKKLEYDQINIQGMHFCSKGMLWEKDTESCPYIKLNLYEDFSDYVSHLKKGLRQDIGRQKRRLSLLGELRYKVYASLEEALKILPEFIVAQKRRWPKDFKPPGFLEAILKEGLPQEIVHFSSLKIEDVPISWHLGFKHNERFYYYMPVYDDKYATYSPSKIQLTYLIEECIRNEITIFDQLRGDEQYKNEWTNDYDCIYGYNRNGKYLNSLIKIKAYEGLAYLKRKMRNS
jgi:CelD/BcsL family acetyltransferase involved in cellulose biosynthesis